MSLTVQDGKLVLRSGALGTGQGCCCGGGGGVCCLPGGTCSTEYATQAECEECGQVNTCYEEMFLEDPEQPCPEGWQGSGGYCFRTTSPASCDDCAGFCTSEQSGPCGVWKSGKECDPTPCCVGSCETSADCAEGCDCPCLGVKSEEFVILRGSAANQNEIDQIIAAMEAAGYTNVRHEYQAEFLADAWLGVCCGDWCAGTVGGSVGGVPYNICACSNTKSCADPENPLP